MNFGNLVNRLVTSLGLNCASPVVYLLAAVEFTRC